MENTTPRVIQTTRICLETCLPEWIAKSNLWIPETLITSSKKGQYFLTGWLYLENRIRTASGEELKQPGSLKKNVDFWVVAYCIPNDLPTVTDMGRRNYFFLLFLLVYSAISKAFCAEAKFTLPQQKPFPAFTQQPERNILSCGKPHLKGKGTAGYNMPYLQQHFKLLKSFFLTD